MATSSSPLINIRVIASPPASGTRVEHQQGRVVAGHHPHGHDVLIAHIHTNGGRSNSTGAAPPRPGDAWACAGRTSPPTALQRWATTGRKTIR